MTALAVDRAGWRLHPARIGDAIVLAGAATWIVGSLLPTTSWTDGETGIAVAGPPTALALLGAAVPDGTLPSLIVVWASAIVAVLAVGFWLTEHPLVALAGGLAATALSRMWAEDVGRLPAAVDGPLGWYMDVRHEAGLWLVTAGLAVMTVGFLVASATGWVTRRSRHLDHDPRVALRIEYAVVVGLIAWTIAQFLPAYTTGTLFGEGPTTVIGLGATLGAWADAMLGDSLAIFVAWTTNIWFAVALVAHWRHHPRAAIVFAVVAVLCAAVGLHILLSGGLPDVGPEATVMAVGVGTWVWVGALVVTLAAMVAWAVGAPMTDASPDPSAD